MTVASADLNARQAAEFATAGVEFTPASKTFQLLGRYVIASNRRNIRSFVIGCLTVFLTVMFLSVVQNSLSKTGLIFMKLAQDQVGAYDFLLTPSSQSANPTARSIFINTTMIRSKLSILSEVAGVAARWLVRGNITSVADGTTGGLAATATIILFDSEYERSIGLAPLWPYRTLGSTEAHASGSLLRALRVRPENGEEIDISFDLGSLLNNVNLSTIISDSLPPSIDIPASTLQQLPPPLLLAFTNLTNVSVADITDSNSSLSIPAGPLVNLFLSNQAFGSSQRITVISAIDSPFGKYPPSLGNVVILEKSFINRFLANAINSLNSFGRQIQALPAGAISFDADDYSIFSLVLLANRAQIYALPDDQRNAAIIDRSNTIVSNLGVLYPVNIVDMLNQALATTRLLEIFLSELFFTVITILGILAIILITSLLLSDIEEKTFEYGMLRTLGLRGRDLIGLLLMQSFLFSIPGIFMGILMCYLLSIPLGMIISIYTGIEYDLSIDPSALVLGIIFGIALPIVGILLPVRRALTKTIRDALDVYHNVVFDTSVRIQRLSDIGLSVDETIVAIILASMGFLVYYLIPLSFVFNNLAMFFRILTIILLGMVCGQVLLAQSVQLPLQIFFAKVLTYFRHRKLYEIVRKNLDGHLARNRKTAAMYTLCLAYLIFAAAMFSLQTSSFSQNIEWINGADIAVKGPSFNKPLPEDNLRRYLQSKLIFYEQDISKTVDGIVANYTFITYDLASFYPVTTASISRLAGISKSTVQIYGLESNFLDSVKTSYFVPAEVNMGAFKFNQTRLSNTFDVVGALFQKAVGSFSVASSIPQLSIASANNNLSALQNSYTNYMPVIISAAVRDTGVITSRSPLVFSLGFQSVSSGPFTLSTLALPVSLQQKMPAFPTVNRLTTSRTPVFISMPNYENLLEYVEQNTNVTAESLTGVSVPKELLLIRVSDQSSPLQVEALVNSLNSLLNDQDFTVTNLREQIASTQSAAALITDVFLIVAIIGVLLSFFVLLLSFIANVRESSWQLGVLRAIGLTERSVLLIYIYEALCVVLACTFLGLLLGSFTAITLTLQSNLFTEMPFVFTFPGSLIAIVVILCLLSAIIGSVHPVKEFNKRPIAITLRG